MYHEAIIADRVARVEATHPRYVPPGGFTRTAVDEVRARQSVLDLAMDDRGQWRRSLTPAEHEWCRNEWVLSKCDFAYWAERYVTINVAGSALGYLYPLWESQRLILDRIALLEKKRRDTGDPDGLCINELKARQLGASTLTAAMIAHRITMFTHTFGLIASDVPESSSYLFGMVERIISHLPWYMKPTTKYHVKDTELVFDTNSSHLWVGSGKSTRGTEGKRGQLGRGKTISAVHLSELSTWEEPQQIDGALQPAVPISSRTLWVNESTAKGRHNWWHQHWLAAKKGVGRFENIFIPWYAEQHKYWRPAPIDWTPKPLTLAHATRCEETSHLWMDRTIQLTRNQLYWYESTRASYEEKDDLSTFLEEYPADDEECFQYSGRSIFGLDVQERIRAQARPLLGVCEVRPRREYVLDSEGHRMTH